MDNKKENPETTENKKKVTKKDLRHSFKIFHYVKPYKGAFILGMIFLIISSFTFMIFPYVTGKLVDIATGKDNFFINDIDNIAIGLGFILLIQAIVSFFRIHYFAIFSEKTMADIRYKAFQKMLGQSMLFFEKRRVGELTSRISSDITQLQTVLSTTMAEFFRQLSVLVVGTVIILLISTQLTMFMLATFPLLIITAIFLGKKIRKISKSTHDELAQTNTIVEETLQAISVVKSFTREWFEAARYKKALNKVVDRGLRAAKFRAGFVSFIIFVLFGGVVLVLWYGAGLVEKGTLTIGELVSFNIYTIIIGTSVGSLGDMYGQMQKTVGASERVVEILETEPELDISKNPEDFSKHPKVNGKIAYNDVSFAYPARPDINVLENVNISANPGEKIALVGHSGAGKSTVLNLLMRFYDWQKGKIEIDDQDICNFDLSYLRNNIGVVPQEVMLFGGTIRENIAYGHKDATYHDILKAAEKANALGFINNLTDGFDTVVGERGVKLSGGQKQRIAIARAILKNPSILILDEATSSLDVESEHLVQEALEELMKNRTTIIIAHRLSTIRKVDKIYVFKNGTIAEEGTHENLYRSEETIYSSLVRMQMEQDEDAKEIKED